MSTTAPRIHKEKRQPNKRPSKSSTHKRYLKHWCNSICDCFRSRPEVEKEIANEVEDDDGLSEGHAQDHDHESSSESSAEEVQNEDNVDHADNGDHPADNNGPLVHLSATKRVIPPPPPQTFLRFSPQNLDSNSANPRASSQAVVADINHDSARDPPLLQQPAASLEARQNGMVTNSCCSNMLLDDHRTQLIIIYWL